MCGIAGLVRYPHVSTDDLEIVEKMLGQMKKRGPDGTGITSQPNAVLAQNRLAVVDLTPHTIPLQDTSGDWTLLFNGEIYNFRDLQKDWGLSQEYRTDSEVLLHGFIKLGPEILDKIEGMYSFFIWNKKTRLGFAARDPLGVKPFFYSSRRTGDRWIFAFCSSAAALIECGLIPFSIHDQSLLEFFVAPYFSGSQSTPFSDVEILKPGHWLKISSEGISSGAFFESPTLKNKIRSADTDSERILESSIRNAIEMQSRAAVEVGIFLSGGLDSSLIASYAPPSTKAWTLKFQGHDAQDFESSLIVKSEDAGFAQKAAESLQLDLSVVSPSDKQYQEALIETLERNDLLAAWEQEVSQRLLAQAAAQSVKAVLVGDAVDETFFGYPFLFGPQVQADLVNLFDFFGVLPIRPGWVERPKEELKKLYLSELEEKGFTWSRASDSIWSINYLVQTRWLQRLLHNGDFHCMDFSLEARVPFSDRTVLSAASSFPASIPEKRVLRNIALKRLPKEIALRPKSALTKNLKSKELIHRMFCNEWKLYADYAVPYLEMDEVQSWTKSEGQRLTDYQIGLEFRILSYLKWRQRFH